MFEKVITAQEAGQTLEKVVQKGFPRLPRSAFFKAVRNKKIKVNRKRAQVKQVLQEGDVVLFFLPPDLLETEEKDYSGNADLDIVYEDADLLVVNKPAGLLSQKDEPGEQDCLDGRIRNYLYQSGQWLPGSAFVPGVAHRLDRNTSGLVMAAKNVQTAQKLAEAIQEHKIGKWYKARIEGELAEPVEIRMRLKKEGTRAVESDDGKEAITLVYPAGHPGLVLCELKTGRFHQIRASLAGIGHPLAGDKKYGSQKEGPYFLQAYKLDLSDAGLDVPNPILELK